MAPNPDKIDQRIEIKFCQRAGLSRKETILQMKAVHGYSCLSDATIRRWFSKFEAGLNRTTDLPRSGAPTLRTPRKIRQVREIIQQDKRQSVARVAARSQLSVGTAHKLLTKDLKLQKKPAKWVPHLLTQPQKDRRVRLAREALHRMSRRRDVSHVICGDESWFHTWDLASKQANRQWINPETEMRPTVVRREIATPKVMLIAFFDAQGLVHREFSPRGLGIGGDEYLAVMECLREAVRRKRPEIFRRNSWGLLHDGAPAHRACPVRDFLNQHNIKVMPHPGYSPDLSPPDYWLFSRLKKRVQGERFHDVTLLENTIDHEISLITAAEWTTAMDRYAPRLRRCIQARGDYFERN